MSRERLGVIGVGYVGLVTAACFAQSGYDVICLDIDEAKLARLRAGETPIHEPGMRRGARRLARAADVHVVGRGAVRARRHRLRVRGHAAERLRRRRSEPRRVRARGDPGRHDRRGAGHEVDRAAGHGGAAAPRARRARPAPAWPTPRTRSSCARAVRSRTSCTPTAWSWARTSPAVGERIAGALPRLRRLRADHRRHLGGDDQARLERVPGDQDLVHQRDRERLRGGRRERRPGRPRHGPRRAHRRRASCGRASASAAPASRRTSPRSSSWRATAATTSSC